MTCEPGPMAGIELFDSPEEAALAGWQSTPKANPRVIAVEPSAQFDGVWVTVQIDGYTDIIDVDTAVCVRVPGGNWMNNGSGGAH